MFKLREKNYERDYFTSALPEPQFGDDVTISSGNVSLETLTLRNVVMNNFSLYPAYQNASVDSLTPVIGVSTNADLNQVQSLNYNIGEDSYPLWSASYPPYDGVHSSNFPVLTAKDNGSEFSMTPFSINELRLAFMMQQMREQINRGGTTFLEVSQALYGIAPSDARLQKPQFLGGAKCPVSVGAVIQTSETTDTSPLGSMAGKAQSANSAKLFRTKRRFEEHGYVITIAVVSPRSSYYGGIPRKFLKKDPIDFYVPNFDRLGEQVISSLELYGDLTNADLEFTDGFGYTPRYSELKSSLSTVHGEFRTTLDDWHLSRTFDSTPFLSTDFIKENKEDFDRIFEFENIEGTSNEHFYCQCIIDLKAKRPMSKYSTPLTLM